MSVQFRFNLQKALEASSVLLELHGQPMKYLGLLKMLYIADRMALDRLEEPITGDNAYSMKYGPVLSTVYDLSKNSAMASSQDLAFWNRFIQNNLGNKTVQLVEKPSIDELCEEEQDILSSVYQEFGHLDPFDVAQWTHEAYPEWQDPKVFNKKRLLIPFDDILKNLHKTDQEIDFIREIALREAYLDDVMAQSNGAEVISV